MHAWVCHELNADGSGLRFETDLPEPSPAAGEVLVDIHAASLNYPDLLMLSGGYQFKPELPFIPGLEASGIVRSVGGGVPDRWIGRHVALGAKTGCLAERIALPVGAVHDAPEGYGHDEAASYQVGALTAYVGLVDRGRLQAEETLLVLGAGGGMGLAAIGVAKAVGAHVIAAASDDAKLAAAQEAGADEVLRIDRAAPNFDDFRESADIVYDPVGGELLQPALRTLSWGGRYMLIGFAGGLPSPFAINYALLKGIEIIGVRAGENSRRNPAAGAHAREAIDAMASSGQYRPIIGMRVPFEEADTAFAAMRGGTLVGKAVIEVVLPAA